MALIESPDDVGAAVVLLPDGQRPYGVGCPLGLPIQSVFFHYDVDAASVQLICDEGFIKKKLLARANPDGDDVQRALFASTISTPIASALQRQLVADAFRRILTVDAMKAVDQPPAKKAKRPIPPASTPDLSTSAPSTSAAALAADSSAASKDVADDSEDNDYDFADDDGVNVDDDVSGDKALSPSRMRDLNYLFRVAGNEVCLSVPLFLPCFAFCGSLLL